MAFLRACILWLCQFCIASPGISSGKAADFYVSKLPGVAPLTSLPEMHAGRLEVATKLNLPESSLFFWHFRGRRDARTTVIWLNGGPGCSSMDGALLEIGPFRFGNAANHEDPSLLYNSHDTWAEVANLLFVDQPFGTGYSDPHENNVLKDMQGVAQAFVEFLKKYVEVFPEFAQTRIILAGESFAGQYIPHIWNALEADPEAWGLIGGMQGVIMVNPFVDPATQYTSSAQFAREHSLLSTQDQWTRLGDMEAQCMRDLQEYAEQHNGETKVSTNSCENVVEYILINSLGGDKKQCINMYDVTLTSPRPQCGIEWPPGVASMTSWLSRKDVHEALHAPLRDGDSKAWEECNMDVFHALKTAESGLKYLPLIPQRVPFMLIIGDNDLICNPIGLDRSISNLKWNGKVGFDDMKSELWITEYGTWRSERNVTVVHVSNSSHMVPVDQLELTRDLLVEIAQLGPEFESHHRNSTANSDLKDQGPSEEEINAAMYRAYGQASVVALIVVLIGCVVLVLIWWRRGNTMSVRTFVHALLHSSLNFKPKSAEYVELRNYNRQQQHRRPDVIIEEDEDEFDV